MRTDRAARAGSVLFATVVLMAALGLIGAAMASMVRTQLRASGVQRASAAARLLARSAADSIVASSGAPGCAADAGLAAVRSGLLPSVEARIEWRSDPQPAGDCRWEVRAVLGGSGGVPIAAHRAVRRTSVP